MKAMPHIVRLDGVSDREILTRFADRQNGIVLCDSGHARFTIGAMHYDMLPGDMLTIGIFTHLTLTELSADFKGTLCIVDSEYIVEAITHVNVGSNIQFVTLYPFTHPGATDREALDDLLGLIERRCASPAEGTLTEMAIDNLVSALIYIVLNSYANASHNITHSSGTKEAIMATFHTDLARDYTAYRQGAHYAKLQNLSPRYFSTTVKAASGYTPLYWINTVVAAEAKRLMRTSNMSIKEIAYYLHFVSPTFFTRWYRECTGETPSQYRSRCRVTLSHNE